MMRRERGTGNRERKKPERFLLSPATTAAASRVPSNAASACGKDPQGGVHGCMPFAVAIGCRVGESRRNSRARRTGCPQGVFAGCLFFWLPFLWTSKEKRPGRIADGTLMIPRSPQRRSLAALGMTSRITRACRRPSATPPAASAGRRRPAPIAHPCRTRRRLRRAQDRCRSSTPAASLRVRCRSGSRLSPVA